MIRITRALISVSDKTGITDFAAALAGLGVEIISTGGTAALLAGKGIRVTPVSQVTGFPEIMDGRVKTLTPQIHAGLLARRDKEEHLEQIREMGISPIDLVVVNLYPFEAAMENPGATFEEVLENIDIGGPAMLRSSAKNFEGVVTLIDPGDYAAVLDSLREKGGVDESLSFTLARKAFRHTSRYDALISSYLETHPPEGMAGPGATGEDFLPDILHIMLHRRQHLRYGENPHQRAALYEVPGWVPAGLVQAEVIQGKALSFNNYLDLDGAWAVVCDFRDETAVAIVKHNNPCGAAVGENPETAYRKALEADPVSAYGGIVGCNRMVTAAMARAMGELFLEAVVAPDYHPDALDIFGKKPNLRVLRHPLPGPHSSAIAPDLRTLSGGLLLQERDRDDGFGPGDLKVVSRRAPTDIEYQAMLFAWKIVRHLKSNAVCFASPERLLSMGSGQTSRVECVRLAMAKSRLSLKGGALASDAFFPFKDSVERIAEAGATAIIQPGGSIRDGEVIAAADAYGMAMVFTGRRHFKH